MAKTEFDKKYEMYNPTTTKRCPNGKATTKNNLHKYVTAAVNLYGCISIEDFLNIYHMQNDEKVSDTELFDLILPLVHKYEEYFFFGNYLINFDLVDEELDFTELIAEQLDKPRYIPDKAEFLNYSHYAYAEQLDYELALPIYDVLKELNTQSNDRYGDFSYIRNAIYDDNAMSHIFDYLVEKGYRISSVEHQDKMLQAITSYMNNKRIWNHNGYSARQIFEMTKDSIPAPSQFHRHVHFGDIIDVNASCPCKSGRTYENCCMNETKQDTAKLSKREARLFYDTWYGLLEYVAKQNDIVSVDESIDFSNKMIDFLLKPACDALWHDPTVITEYISNNTLSSEQVALLESWRDYHIEGYFFVIKHTADFSVFASIQKDSGSMPFYGVKGMSQSISTNLDYDLPYIVHTVILPFKNHLVYDTFLGKCDIDIFEQHSKKEFNDDLILTMKEQGIIVNFNKEHNKRILH